jgi:hypothetical protein
MFYVVILWGHIKPFLIDYTSIIKANIEKSIEKDEIEIGGNGFLIFKNIT